MTIQQAFALAQQQQRAGRLAEAEQICRQLVAQNPAHLDALHLLGVVAFQMGRDDLALQWFQRIFSLNPDWPEASNNLANLLAKMGRYEEAIAISRRVVALRPAWAEAHANLGNAFRCQGELAPAIAAYQRAVTLDPNLAVVWHNLGVALRDKGEPEAAAVAYRRALALASDYPEAHLGLGQVLLQQGHLAQGWPEYEWRWKTPPLLRYRRDFAQPLWKGEELHGRRLLLYTEQGFGDTIQFIRYLPQVAARGGRVVLICPAELLRLAAGMPEIDQLVPAGEPVPDFDVHFPLLSLPCLFGTTLETIPSSIPYVRPPCEAVERWRQRLESGCKVGLVWAGNPDVEMDRYRSPRSLEWFAPLASVKNARFFSLQKGEPARQAKSPPPGLHLVDYTDELHDFAETAALIANLDVVITSDTSVAHLAGAMGARVWTLLHTAPDFRWLLKRADSPWYPTMRLFRQSVRGDWTPVIAEVAGALNQFASS